MAASLDKQTVIDLLADLKRTDRQFKNFGSGAHRYELNRPLPQADIEAFESEHNIRLPEDYRFFITEIGNGGAGPYYGLFPFGYQDDLRGFSPWENGYIVGDLSAEFPHQDKWNLPDSFWEQMPDPGPEVSLEEEHRMMEAWDKELEKHYWNPKIMNGAIPICHLGCALRQWLVVNGAQKGFVWADDRVDHAGIYPLHGEQDRQRTFSDWYMSWLRKPFRI
jgi:hypothetical protein